MLQNLSFAGELLFTDGAEELLQRFVNGRAEEVEGKVVVNQIEKLSREERRKMDVLGDFLIVR